MLIKTVFLCSFIFGLGLSTLSATVQRSEGIKSNCHTFQPPDSYPLAWRNESLIESRHGIEIADPYRWLENPYSVERKQFIAAENQLTDAYLKSCDAWQKINKRLTAVWNYTKYSAPQYQGRYYVWKMNTGLQNQDVVYKQVSLDDEPSVLLDPNEMSSDGTIALNSLDFSLDGKLLAYSFSKSGSDWQNVRIRNVDTGKDYPETLNGLKFSTNSWTHDNKGFFYSRYLKYGDGTEIDLDENQKVYYHRVGELQDKDILVAEIENPKWDGDIRVSSNGKYAILMTAVNAYLNHIQIYMTNLEKVENITGKLLLTPIFTGQNNSFAYVTNLGSKAVFLTNRNASNHRLVAIDFENPAEENWSTIIQEHPTDVLYKVQIFDGKIWTIYLHDAKRMLQVHSLQTGKMIQRLYFGIGSIEDVTIGKTPSEIFFTIKSYLTPGTIYRYDSTKPEAVPTIYREEKINVNGFDKKDYVVKQIFYRSYDGTRVPMTIVQKKASANRGPRPCLMYAYGGFKSSISPSYFNAAWIYFVEAFNGVLAVPNIRGGGEYGSNWHLAGSMLNKQNSYDDFYAASEYLIENKYTTSEQLAIRGASNSGLMVGVSINQRPQLYKAAIAQVGVMDMLRYHKFTCGFSFTSEYGNPDEKVHFKNLLKYSPLHNIRTPNSTENRYPSTLIVTADHDDRVSTLHSLKYAATLQHAVQGNKYQTNPILMNVLAEAGHSAGKPTYKLLGQETDFLTFLCRALPIEVEL